MCIFISARCERSVLRSPPPPLSLWVNSENNMIMLMGAHCGRIVAAVIYVYNTRPVRSSERVRAHTYEQASDTKVRTNIYVANMIYTQTHAPLLLVLLSMLLLAIGNKQPEQQHCEYRIGRCRRHSRRPRRWC